MTPRHTTAFEREFPTEQQITRSLNHVIHDPFWLSDITVKPRPGLDQNRSVDLAVVGGGYTGLWSAIEAKERHPEWNIILLEANTVGWAASGRNGGFCEASLTHGYDNGASRWPEQIDTLEAMGQLNLDEIEERIRRYGIDCEFERTGAIELAVEEYQAEQLAAQAPELDADHLFFNKQEIQAEIASPTYLAGVWAKKAAAMIHPAKLVAGLSEYAERIGVEIYEHSRGQRDFQSC